MNAPQLTLAIDLKKNRIRIHKNTLHALGEPERVQLLLNPQKRTLLISCPTKSIPESQDEKVIFDKPGTDGTYQLYSLELIRRIRILCPEMQNYTLYHITGKYLPTINAAYFPLENLIAIGTMGETNHA